MRAAVRRPSHGDAKPLLALERQLACSAASPTTVGADSPWGAAVCRPPRPSRLP